MASTFTPNINLEEPARGDAVGVWDTPVNSNTTLVDLVVGGLASIALNNSPVVLSAGQFQAKTLVFSSTLTGSVAITFPSTFQKSYEIRNVCTGSSAFVITLQTTVAGGNVICAPPGETLDILLFAGSLFFRNLGPIGSYMDYAGSSAPLWVTGCTVAPYLNCDGSTFSATLFPALAVILGSTTLPDFRGHAPYYLNQGTGRLTSAGAGIDGNTRFAAGGSNGTQLVAANIPSITSVNAAQAITVAGPTVGDILSKTLPPNAGTDSFQTGADGYSRTNSATFFGSNAISVAYTNAATTFQVGAPGTVSGIRMIRAG